MYTRNISIHSFIQSQDFISTKNYLTYNKCLEQRLIDVGIQMKGLLNLYSNSMRVQHLDLYLKKIHFGFVSGNIQLATKIYVLAQICLFSH